MKLEMIGKCAIITGASGGIGRAIAMDLAYEGINLSLGYHSRSCDTLVDDLNKMNVRAIQKQVDVSDSESVNDFVEESYKKLGRIDILVNNAGIGFPGPTYETSEEDWDKVLAINLKSIFIMSKSVIGYMKKQKYGRIINIGSVIAKTGTNAQPWLDIQSSSKVGGGAYAASKAGVHALTKTFAKELIYYNINVNCVAPGPIKTNMVPSLPDPIRTQLPVGTIGNPEDVSAYVTLLASTRGDYITGEIIDVNGGLWMD